MSAKPKVDLRSYSLDDPCMEDVMMNELEITSAQARRLIRILKMYPMVGIRL